MKTLHHLLRVRMKTTRFQKLQEIADAESKENGTYVSVSDIVRIAIENWIQTYESQTRLRESLEQVKKN